MDGRKRSTCCCDHISVKTFDIQVTISQWHRKDVCSLSLAEPFIWSCVRRASWFALGSWFLDLSLMVGLPFAMAANTGRCFTCACYYSPLGLLTSAVAWCRPLSMRNEAWSSDRPFETLNCAANNWQKKRTIQRHNLACPIRDLLIHFLRCYTPRPSRRSLVRHRLLQSDHLFRGGQRMIGVIGYSPHLPNAIADAAASLPQLLSTGPNPSQHGQRIAPVSVFICGKMFYLDGNIAETLFVNTIFINSAEHPRYLPFHRRQHHCHRYRRW